MTSSNPLAEESPPGDTTRATALPTDVGMLLGLGGMLLLVVLGIAIAVWLILDLRQTTTDLTERELDYAAAIGDIALISKTLANDERGYLITGSDEFLRQFEGRTAQLNEAFTRAYADANDEQWQAVDRAKRSFDAWHAATTRDLALFTAGNRDAAIDASMEHTRQLRKEYEARLSGTQSLAKFEIEAASAEVAETLTRSVTVLIGYLIVAVLIGGLIAAWLLRRGIEPVEELLAMRANSTDARSGTAGLSRLDRNPPG